MTDLLRKGGEYELQQQHDEKLQALSSLGVYLSVGLL